MAPHLLAELPAVVVAHIARRGSDHLGHTVLLHIFRHIHPDHRILIAKQSFRQRFGKFRLSHAGRSQEQERTNGASGIFQPHSSPSYCLRHSGHCLFLADHPLVQGPLQVPETFPFRLLQPAHRNFGPRGDHVRDISFCHAKLLACVPLPEPLPGLLKLLLCCLLLPVQKACLGHISLADRLLHLTLQPLDHRLQFIDGIRDFKSPQAYPGTGLVQDVDGFVRKEPVAHIPVCQLHRSLQRFILDRHMVVLFVFPPQSLQDLQTLFPVRLFHRNRLEPPLQGCVLLNVFPVFRNGGGADQLQFSPCQGRLQDIGSVNGPLRAACPNDSVDFIQEKDHISRSLHFLDQALHPLLEFSAVLGTGYHSRKIHGQDPLILHAVRHCA